MYMKLKVHNCSGSQILEPSIIRIIAFRNMRMLVISMHYVYYSSN